MNHTKEKHWEYLLRSNRKTTEPKNKDDETCMAIAEYLIMKEQKAA